MSKKPLMDAQEIIYDAWEESNPRVRVALANKALAISPLCADAYNLLAEAAKTLEEKQELYHKGVKAGEKALGSAGFKRCAGVFWYAIETRPYMRARFGLALMLEELGDLKAAIDHYQAMLKLNPSDNQGVRYSLSECLMKNGDTTALKKLLKDYREETAFWLYTIALVGFREKKNVIGFAKRAYYSNKHILAALMGTKRVKKSRHGTYSHGGIDEAAIYLEGWTSHWINTPGAVDWLMKTVTVA
jgi:tetratricopeptide (TPR) repeat protein